MSPRENWLAALVYGAEVLQSAATSTALDTVREAAEKYPVTLVNSVNPYRLQGQKTAAFEIGMPWEMDPTGCAFPWATPAISLPIGWVFRDQQWAEAEACPDDVSQASGSAPLVNDTTVTDPETIATAIRIGTR